ncbi:hypothetical protein CAter282_3483 [Collimonas arenae]|uniref:Uncharacterized protein n=1 Tax=Collimonas arenae TaxID=279058 RepID=A0A127QM86_9BURK|nr:hypothetical protein CAter10_3814 [Collimonas arenae]AMP11173.1 hypothetical protein CAter282_3483 [Collimonas arenae]
MIWRAVSRHFDDAIQKRSSYEKGHGLRRGLSLILPENAA